MARILTIAGSDSGGGAGVQIDMKTALAIGCDSSCVITALTAQNTREVRSVRAVDLPMIEDQFRAVFDDIAIDAVKIGMLGSAAVAALVGRLLVEYHPLFVVADPVLVATSGAVLGDQRTGEAIVEHILPLCTLLTPNIDEAIALSGIDINGERDGERVWRFFQSKGLSALLLKGGHAERWQGRQIVDTLYTENGVRQYIGPRIATSQTHGTGCTLSSAIASHLSLGVNLVDAVGLGVDFVRNKLINSL